MFDNNEVSVGEALAFHDRDQSQLIDVALGGLITAYKITKIVYRQKTVGMNEYQVEVLPQCEGELDERTLDSVSGLCRRFAENNFFNCYEGVQGVIYLQDDKVMFTGDKLAWDPLYL